MVEGELVLAPILDPFGAGGVGAGPLAASLQFREIDHAHRMAARVARGIGIYADETKRAGLDARLFEKLAPASRLDRLADLGETPG